MSLDDVIGGFNMTVYKLECEEEMFGLHVPMCPVTSARYGMLRRRGDCETATSFIMVTAGCDW